MAVVAGRLTEKATTRLQGAPSVGDEEPEPSDRPRDCQRAKVQLLAEIARRCPSKRAD